MAIFHNSSQHLYNTQQINRILLWYQKISQQKKQIEISFQFTKGYQL